MNDVLTTIQTRRSIRNFSNQPLSLENLRLILEAATYAPSGMNTQSWQFTVITNSQKLAQLHSISGKVLGKADYGIYGAPAFILVSNERGYRNGLADCAVALQTIFLAAKSLGIGSCWINQLKDICDDTEIRPVLSALGVPENHVIYGGAALGYAVEEPIAPPRKSNTIVWVK